MRVTRVSFFLFGDSGLVSEGVWVGGFQEFFLWGFWIGGRGDLGGDYGG